ncbi:DUF6428 family protein [Aureitalea marina]|uniref:Uncharacterized protein n=1 Tax=Aureitalea marina TaxID=930804 RepID=A0A2S7KRK7_9FLAO|nr:DUF6428 family protein [Aureitalea marina]PQB05261.1 hypothetical protein BST85_10465 [Aureitalea marina]
MRTQELLNLLAEHTGKSLLFEYSPGKLVNANYHITEVKHLQIDSVDCGARTDAWKETVIQLWESPSEIGKTEYMTVYKALSILKKVGRMKPYVMDSEAKIEYGNDEFHTAQLFINDFEIGQKELRLKLAVEPTDCKAKDACGVPEPATTEVEACCEPGGGCC